MKRILSAFAVCMVAGCAGSQLAPPGMPTVPQVRAQQAMTAAIPLSEVHDFYSSGLLLAQMNCGGYFDMAVMNALQSAQTAGQAQILSGLALGIMGLVGVGGPAVAGVGLGASFVNNILSNQQANSLAGTDPAGMYTLTTTAQAALINATPEPTNPADAYSAIYAIYRQCSPAGIQALKEQAVNAATNHLVVSGQPLTGAAQLGMRSVIRPAIRAIPSVRVQ